MLIAYAGRMTIKYQTTKYSLELKQEKKPTIIVEKNTQDQPILII